MGISKRKVSPLKLITALVIVCILLCTAYTMTGIVQLWKTEKGLKNEILIQTKVLDKLKETESQVAKLNTEESKLGQSLDYLTQDGLYMANLSNKLASENLAIKNYNTEGIEEINGILAISISIELQGNYNSVCNVIKYIENAGVFIQVQDIEMIRSDKLKNTTGLLNGEVNLKMNIVLYSKVGADKNLLKTDYNSITFGKINPFSTDILEKSKN